MDIAHGKGDSSFGGMLEAETLDVISELGCALDAVSLDAFPDELLEQVLGHGIVFETQMSGQHGVEDETTDRRGDASALAVDQGRCWQRLPEDGFAGCER